MQWNKIKTGICICLTFIWIAIIFSFSLQPAKSSDQTSSGLLIIIIDTLATIFGDGVEKFLLERVDLLHHIIRKCAHFTEFCILGGLTALSLNIMRLKYKVLYGVSFCVLIASIDETIQRFVPGRSGQISDVMLDSVGALTGICLIMLIYTKGDLKI